MKSLRSSLDDTEERRLRISLLRSLGLILQLGVGAIMGESVSEATGAFVGEGGTGEGPGPGFVVGGLIVGGLRVGPGTGFIVGGFIVGGLGVGDGPSLLDLLLDLDMLLLKLPRLRKKYSVSAISSKSPNAS